jgi:internalin A
MKKIIILVGGLALLLQAVPAMGDPTKPAKTKIFTQWCQERKSASAATKLTIDLLLKQAGTKNCKLANSKLTKLEHLDLSNSKISDLTPLASLTKLNALELSTNQISDLKPLTSLTKLRGLYLSANQVSDLKPLAGLTNLNWIHLTTNKISNIEPLSGLIQLTTLYLQHNQISEIMLAEKLIDRCKL